jgi:hypothetical protein
LIGPDKEFPGKKWNYHELRSRLIMAERILRRKYGSGVEYYKEKMDYVSKEVQRINHKFNSVMALPRIWTYRVNMKDNRWIIKMETFQRNGINRTIRGTLLGDKW